MIYSKNVNNNGNNSNSIKKWSNITGLALLTIGLMIIFKNNTNQINSIENKLINFYTKNLQPLFTKTEITNEDIFNFALYQNLPIDRQQNKILEIGEISGEKVDFKIKTAVISSNTNNYQKFIEHYNLNEIQQNKLDSLLRFYKFGINSAILINDNDVVAVDPNIVLLRQAMIYDIANFLKTNNFEGDNVLWVDQNSDINDYELRLFEEVKKLAYQKDKESYLFFGKDTVFRGECSFNDITNPINSKNIVIKLDLENDNKFKKNKLGIVGDSIIYRKGKNEGMVAQVVFPILKDISVFPNNVITIQKKINVPVKKDYLNDISEIHKIKVIDYDLNIKNIDSIVEMNVKFMNEENIKTWVSFGLKIDSLSKNGEWNISNSEDVDMEEINRELKKLKIELKNLKKQNNKTEIQIEE